jgi:hypothetical protein
MLLCDVRTFLICAAYATQSDKTAYFMYKKPTHN